MKVSSAIAEILQREGVDVIFGYPRNAVLETAAELGIRPIFVRQERTGVHMADALSRLTRGKRMGVFAMQHGPGTENAYGGVAQAYSESVPVLVLPQGYDRRIAHVPDNYNASISMRDVSKHAEPITVASETANILRRAFTQLRNGRLRPVIVEMPRDVLGEDIGDTLDYTPVVSTRSGPDPEAIRQAAKMLVEASRPVIHAGQGVHWANAYAPLRELAELLAAPVSTSLEGKSTFDETHPLALGSGGAAIPGQLRHFLNHSDVIFGIGCSFAQTDFGVSMPEGKRVIHATLDPADFNKKVTCELALMGDAALTLSMLVEACRTLIKEPRDPAPVAEEIARVEREWLSEWVPLLTSEDAPISPYRVLWDLQQEVDVANTIITHDAGSPRDQLSPFWKTTQPLTYLGWGKSTQLGYGLGLAMGAKFACPDKLCINVWGDAAIGFTGMDFETAVREKLPILSILLNNHSMAIELPQMPAATEKFRSTDISGHYADFAKALGGYGERVTDPADIRAAIRRGIEATERGQAALLEFMTTKETRASRL
ncbi:thiamine pyrophosphate-requiring protein [Altericroceibacterium endophyticum]|uniref:Thiamine pyrophosphate-requiring protein n=1 Tax=Altericroceibacterium endophyticum TaxID=1808508 RepID=A0A6I4T4G7_9SPHN|nr:thiamine pyrophosphate-requiring protein [Altericroceibacterium endophyticum]MXO65279.1 thiamine pyrophosphate-requiring protein [Altericroceibacterium endophyticum]